MEIPCVIFSMTDDEWPLKEGDPRFVVSSPPLFNLVLCSLCAKGEVDLLSITELIDLGMLIARVESLTLNFHKFDNVTCGAQVSRSFLQSTSMPTVAKLCPLHT